MNIDLIQHHFTETQINVLDHGFVRLVDSMPRLVEIPDEETVHPNVLHKQAASTPSGIPITAEYAITQAARVSYGAGTKTVNEDRGLIRYLLRHMHTTPFEMVEFKFHCKMPIFVARQWIRHRTANVNEISGRYSVLPNEFYIPTSDGVRQQSTKNKQCSEGQVENQLDAQEFVSTLDKTCSDAYAQYEKALESGVGREQARMLLPQNLYTAWYWKIDLHNLLHFLKLRCDAHAQYEIRVFADAMLKLITPLVPWTIEAWNDFDPYRGAVKLSRLEWEKVKDFIKLLRSEDAITVDHQGFTLPLGSGNKREDEEWLAKLTKMLEQ
jgi:thymidylate synthase (FAD)